MNDTIKDEGSFCRISIIKSAHERHTPLNPVSLWLAAWNLDWENKVRGMTRRRQSTYMVKQGRKL